jgi:hypothetical protein
LLEPNFGCTSPCIWVSQELKVIVYVVQSCQLSSRIFILFQDVHLGGLNLYQ